MPHPHAAALLASQLHELTADDGTTLTNNQLIATKSMPQAWHDDITKHRLGQAQGIVKVIEDAGGQIVMPGDTAPAQESPPQWVEIHCRACGNVMQKVNLTQPDVAHARYMIQAFKALDEDCPHHADAVRQ